MEIIIDLLVIFLLIEKKKKQNKKAKQFQNWGTKTAKR